MYGKKAGQSSAQSAKHALTYRIRGAMRVGYRIAMDEQRPTWNEGDFFGEMFGNQ